jgi:hypothetical protein
MKSRTPAPDSVHGQDGHETGGCTMLRRWLLAVLVLLTLGARQATAEVITWQFTGAVDTASAGLSSFFPVGTAVEFTLTYDTDWTPLVTSSTENSYAPTSSTPAPFFDYTISMGGHEFFRSSSGLPFLRAQPDRLVLDTSLSGTALDGLPVGSGPQWWPVAFDAAIAFPAGPIALPTALPETLTDSTFVLYMSSFGPAAR